MNAKRSFLYIIFTIFLIPSKTFAIDGYTETTADLDVSTYCSEEYLNLDHKINQAYEAMLDTDLEKSKRMYEDIKITLEILEIPISEKIELANRVSQGYYDLLEDKKGLLFAQKYLDIAEQSLASDDYQLGKAYERLAAFQLKVLDVKSAYENITSAIDILGSHSQQFLVYFELGNYYRTKNMLQQAIYTYQLAVDNFDLEDKSVRNMREQFFVYYRYSGVLAYVNDFGKAEHFMIAMEKLNKEIDDVFIDYLLFFRKSQSHLYSKQYGYDLSIIEFDSNDPLAQYLESDMPEHPFINSYLPTFFYFMAGTYLTLGDYDKAIEFFQKTISIEEENGSNSNLIGRSYSGTAICYHFKGDAKLSIQLFEQALSTLKNNDVDGINGFLIMKLYTDLGYAYLADKEFEKARIYLLASLDQDQLQELRLTGIQNLLELHLSLFKIEQTEDQVDSVLHYMDESAYLIEQLRVKTRYYSDQQSVEESAYAANTFNLTSLEYIYSSSDKYDYLKDRLFTCIEGVKAFSFKQELREKEGLYAFGLPHGLLNKIEEQKRNVKLIQDEIYKYEQTYVQLDKQLTNKAQIENLQLELGYAIDEYNRTLQSVEKDYTSYFNYKFKNNSVSIENVQDVLQANEMLVEYYTSDTSIFIISIEQDTFRFNKKQKPKDWDTLIADYSNSVTNNSYQHEDSTSVNYAKFTHSSHELYRILLKDVIDEADTLVTHLTIVPDETIHSIQFDNLLVENPTGIENYKDLDYLLHDYSISRSTSAYMYTIEKLNTRERKAAEYTGFAPIYETRKTSTIDNLEEDRNRQTEFMNDFFTGGFFFDLVSARKSVNIIAEDLGGQAIIGERATKNTFINKATKASIIHFAGHALADNEEPEYSQLLFSHEELDSQLYASDIYDLNLDIDLLVLSACNTGNGQLNNGEGVMSLSRAFAFAGCSSMVMSLWSIPDVQTAQLNQLFFKEINEGERIDDALRNSKLAFLEASTFQTAHPFYWSGLSASGKMEPVKKRSFKDRIRALLGLSI